MEPLDLRTRPPRSCYLELDGLMLMPRTIDKLRGQLPGGDPGGYFINGPIKGISGYLLERLGVAEADLLAIVARAMSDDEVGAWLRERTDPSQYTAINATLRRIRPKHAEDEAFFRNEYAPTLRQNPELEYILEIVDADDRRRFACVNEGSAMHDDAARLIRDLGLRPHPEGGYFTEKFRSDRSVVGAAGDRSAVTSIYYLLSGDDFSAFHRIKSDELWHFYEGGDVAIECIDPDGGHRRLVIGPAARQAAIRPGVWFAAHLADAAGYALVGCDVAPGFEYRDFEIASRAELLSAFPEHAPLIERLTR